MRLLEPQFAYTAVGIASEASADNPRAAFDMITLEDDEYGYVTLNGEASRPLTVEWPPKGYVPYALTPQGSEQWSFSVYDPADADPLTGAVVTVTFPDGTTVTPTVVHDGTDGTLSSMRDYDSIAFTLNNVGRPKSGATDVYTVAVTTGGRRWEYAVNIYASTKGVKRNAGNGGESLGGTDGNDTLVGGAGYDELEGDAGSDVLRGKAGKDTLIGEAGKDTLYGGAGKDFLNGARATMCSGARLARTRCTGARARTSSCSTPNSARRTSMRSLTSNPARTKST